MTLAFLAIAAHMSHASDVLGHWAGAFAALAAILALAYMRGHHAPRCVRESKCGHMYDNVCEVHA